MTMVKELPPQRQLQEPQETSGRPKSLLKKEDSPVFQSSSRLEDLEEQERAPDVRLLVSSSSLWQQSGPPLLVASSSLQANKNEKPTITTNNNIQGLDHHDSSRSWSSKDSSAHESTATGATAASKSAASLSSPLPHQEEPLLLINQQDVPSTLPKTSAISQPLAADKTKPALDWSFVRGHTFHSSHNRPQGRGGTIKLYDRQTEVQMLHDAFFRRWPQTPRIIKPVTDDDATTTTTTTTTIFPELVLVSGSSGTGKTVLARQVMNQLIQEHKEAGFCVLGKFDQLNNLQVHQEKAQQHDNNSNNHPVVSIIPEPYSAFVGALTELARLWQSQAGTGTNVLERIHYRLDTALAGGVDDETWAGLRALVPALECVFSSPHKHQQQETEETDESISDASSGIANQTNKNSDNHKKKVYEAQQDGLKNTFKLFIEAVFSSTEPLVILLDDLQWADTGSLDLLEALVSDPDLFESCLFVGICRSNEVPWHHDFACTLRRLEDVKRTKITNIQVHNLSLHATAELVADVLHQPIDLCQGVAQIIHDKTQGNVFFVLQIMKALYEEGVLIAEAAAATTTTTASGDDSEANVHNSDPQGHLQWLWHDHLWNEYFQTQDLTAVDLVLRHMKRLPEACQKLLMTAACIGAEFDSEILLAVLVHMIKNSRVDDNQSLYESMLELSLQEGLLIQQMHHEPGRLAFAHDRVQQAAYALIPEDRYALTHLAIGRSLFDMMSSEMNPKCADSGTLSLEDHIFLVVNQLIRGGSLLETEEDRRELSFLCLEAGRKATSSSDFRMAVHYFQLGTTFLPGRRPWRDEYSLCLELHNSLAETQCVVTAFEAMDSTIQEILGNAINEQDKFRAYTTRVYSHGAQLKLQEAIDLGIDVVSRYGEKFPKRPTIFHLLIDIMKTQMRLRGKTDRDILSLPAMSYDHEDKAAAMRLLNSLAGYSFLARPDFFPFVTLKCIKITLKYGLCAISAPSFAFYGVLCLALDDVESGYRYSNLAVQLLDSRYKRSKNEWLARVYAVHYGMVALWKTPIRSCVDSLLQAYVAGRRTGDTESVAIALQFYCENSFYAGRSLPTLQSDLVKYLDIMATCKQGPFYASSRLLLESVLNLMGKSKYGLDDTVHMLIYENEVNFNTYTCEVCIQRLINSYYLGDLDAAMENAEKSRVAEEVLKPCYSYCAQFFYDALTSLALAWESKKRKRIAHAKVILKKLEKLDSHCSHNLHHKVCLIKAELMFLDVPRKRAKLEKAMELYKLAAHCAAEEGFLQIKALALERAGVALRRLGFEARSDNLLKEAKEAYRDWGADAIVDSFLKRYSI